MSWQAYSRLQLALAHFGQPFWMLTADQLPELERQLARKLMLEHQVVAHPLAAQIQVTPQAIYAARAEVLARYGSEEALNQALQQAGLNDAELQQALLHELSVAAVLDQVVADIQPLSEAEARRYYLDHPRRFLRPERREVRHILITTDEQQPENLPVLVLRRMVQLRGELLEHPERFGELALRHSECPTAMERGRIGYVVAGQLYPELDSALFALRLGELSEVVESPMGLHLLQCLDIQEAEPMPMEQALPLIIERHLQQARQQQQRLWLKRLQRRAQDVAVTATDPQTTDPCH